MPRVAFRSNRPAAHRRSRPGSGLPRGVSGPSHDRYSSRRSFWGQAHRVRCPAALQSPVAAARGRRVAGGRGRAFRDKRDWHSSATRCFPWPASIRRTLNGMFALDDSWTSCMASRPDIARQYLDGELDFPRASAALERDALMPSADATLKFLNQFRSYAATYTIGRDALSRYLDAHSTADDPASRWRAYINVVTDPVQVVPSERDNATGKIGRPQLRRAFTRSPYALASHRSLFVGCGDCRVLARSVDQGDRGGGARPAEAGHPAERRHGDSTGSDEDPVGGAEEGVRLYRRAHRRSRRAGCRSGFASPASPTAGKGFPRAPRW